MPPYFLSVLYAATVTAPRPSFGEFINGLSSYSGLSAGRYIATLIIVSVAVALCLAAQHRLRPNDSFLVERPFASHIYAALASMLTVSLCNPIAAQAVARLGTVGSFVQVAVLCVVARNVLLAWLNRRGLWPGPQVVKAAIVLGVCLYYAAPSNAPHKLSRDRQFVRGAAPPKTTISRPTTANSRPTTAMSRPTFARYQIPKPTPMEMLPRLTVLDKNRASVDQLLRPWSEVDLPDRDLGFISAEERDAIDVLRKRSWQRGLEDTYHSVSGTMREWRRTVTWMSLKEQQERRQIVVHKLSGYFADRWYHLSNYNMLVAQLKPGSYTDVRRVELFELRELREDLERFFGAPLDQVFVFLNQPSGRPELARSQ